MGAIVQLVLRLLTLDVVPKGMLTKISGGLAVVVAAGNAAAMGQDAITEGTIPDVDSLEFMLTTLLATVGGGQLGIGRKIDS